MANPYGISDDVWSVFTPEERANFSSGNVSQSSIGAATGPPPTASSSGGNTSFIMPQFTPYNPAADIERLKQAQIKATKASLDKQKAASLSSLQTEKATIEPAYQKQKIQAGVNAQKQARSFEEYMAQRGGGATKSGIAAQGALMNQNALQRNMGELNTAEANALTQNAQRVTDTENAYLADITAAEAGANANAMQMQIQANQQAAQQELAYRQWMYQQQQAQAQNQFNQGLSLAQLTGMYQGSPTLGYTQTMAGLTGTLPGGGQTLAAQQQAFNNKLAEQELALARQRALSGGQPTAQDLTTQSYNEIDNLLGQGMTYDQVRAEIQRNESELRRNNLSPSKLYDYLDSSILRYNYDRANALGLMQSGEL